MPGGLWASVRCLSVPHYCLFSFLGTSMRVNESRADVGNEIYAPPRPLYFWALWGSSGVLRRPAAGPDREPSALSRSHVVNRLCIRGEDTNDGKCLIPRPRSAPALAFSSRQTNRGRVQATCKRNMFTSAATLPFH